MKDLPSLNKCFISRRSMIMKKYSTNFKIFISLHGSNPCNTVNIQHTHKLIMHKSTSNLSLKEQKQGKKLISIQSIKVKTQFLHFFSLFTQKTMKSFKFVRRSRLRFSQRWKPDKERGSQGGAEGVKRGGDTEPSFLGVGSEELIQISTC